MRPTIPGPTTLFSVAGRGVDQVERALSLIPRVADAVSAVETLLARVDEVVTSIELARQEAQAVVDRVSAVADRADAVVDRVAAIAERAELIVEQAAGVTAQVAPLLDQFDPTLQQLHPILDRITTTTAPDEVAAVVEMVNLTPDLVAKLQTDIIPVLDTLGTVAPDVRDLLDVSKELNSMLAGLPGLGRIKRKVDDQQAAHDDYRADEEPPSSPDRGL
jgi:ABC-type transporter Mla subunit MlaD